MRAFEIYVVQESRAVSLGDAPGVRKRARDMLDVFVGGANVTARVGDGNGAAVLRDLAHGVAALCDRARGKAIVRFYEQPWELCVERLGALACVSVYRTGAAPEVAVYDAEVPFSDVVFGVRAALRTALDDNFAPQLKDDLEHAASVLAGVDASADDELVPDSALAPVSLELEPDAPIAFAADFVLREGPKDDTEASVEHADLHGLLFAGRLRAVVRGREVDLGEAHPFLFAERLLSVMRRATEAFEQGRAMQVREEAGGILLGLRLGADGEASLVLSPATKTRALCTFPALSIDDLTFAALAFGRSLVRAILRRDRSQAQNLRLSSFRRELRDAQSQIREACRDDAKTNPAPEAYRAFAATARPPRVAENVSSAPSRLRYVPRWRALVPGIDLRATFLGGDRLIVGASQETFCLDRATGEVAWRVPTRRASSVVTPSGVARLHADGELVVHDFGTGEVSLRTRLLPRTGGPPAGAVVNLPGLPRLLIVAEGDKHLVAVDLRTGEARWRFAWGKSGLLRLKRHGRLLYFTSGDSALSALDVQTGAVVWRVRDRLRFHGTPTLDHDALFAVAGGSGGATRLYGVDPFSGHVRFERPVPGPDSSGELHERSEVAATVEGSPLVAGRTVVVVVRDRHGVTLAGFDRDGGALRWTSKSTVAPVGTSWLAFDELLLGNTPTGELVAIDAETGALRYRQVLGRALEADVPRRLEPVLRGGAVYVPHTDVHVFRPTDGALLATIGPCEAIPDMLRVDERCDVYVAEESGHMACFGVTSRLSLVR